MIYGTMCYLHVNEKTLFLYRNRGETDIHQGFYVPPGGRLEQGEKSVNCIIREFSEETGLTLINPRLRIIATFDNRNRILNGQLNPEDWRVDVYKSDAFSGEIKPENSKDKLVWVSDAELHNLRMYEGDKRLFRLLRKEGVFEVRLTYSGEKLKTFDVKKLIKK